jgi:uncharacterized RDD family membrane protein YckC
MEGAAFERSEPRGTGLGLPPEGPGSLASTGIRLAGFLLDSIVANLLAGLPYLFGVSYGPGVRGYVVYAAFLLQEFVLVSATGASIGKHLCGIRVVRAADGGRLAWPWVLARTLLLGVLVPVVVWDRDGRGLHDRAAGALTVRVGQAPAASTAASGTRSGSQPAADAPAPRVERRPASAGNGSAVRSGSATAKPSPRRRKKRR